MVLWDYCVMFWFVGVGVGNSAFGWLWTILPRDDVGTIVAIAIASILVSIEHRWWPNIFTTKIRFQGKTTFAQTFLTYRYVIPYVWLRYILPLLTITLLIHLLFDISSSHPLAFDFVGDKKFSAIGVFISTIITTSTIGRQRLSWSWLFTLLTAMLNEASYLHQSL